MIKKVLALLVWSLSLQCFTLEQAERYASSVPEFPVPKGPSFLMNPDYSRWHLERSRNIFRRIKNSIVSHWSPRDFSRLLSELSDQRVKQRLERKHSVTLAAKTDTEIVIIGPLFGAFHSFVRILKELKSQDYITDDLTLTRENSYLVFIGDVTDGSAYNMETLTLVLALMKANPHQVIFLAGEKENNDSWLGYSLKKELSVRARSSELESAVTTFFNTLPQALFISHAGSDNEMIRVGNRIGCTPPRIPRLGVVTVCAGAKGIVPQVSTIIIPEKRLMSYRHHNGLILATPQEGALTWTVFSAPTILYKDHYFFHKDAYTKLTIGPTLSSSVLSLYNQDIFKKIGFQHAARFSATTALQLQEPPAVVKNPFTGDYTLQKCQKKTDKDYTHEKAQKEVAPPLYIGCTLDLSKGASPLGKKARDGITLFINEVNAAGGVQGRTVKVIFMDDEYSPEKARINVEQFMTTYKSNLFLGNLGSPTLQAYRDLMKEGKIFVFFPVTGAPIFRTADLPGVIHWRASYKAEAHTLTKYMYDVFRVRSFAFLYQNDAFGLGALEGAQLFLTKEGITQIAKAPYERNVTAFDQQIAQIKDAATTGIGFFSTSLAAIEFIRQAGVNLLIGKKLFGISDLAEETFIKFAQQRGLDFTIAQFAPNPKTSSMQIVEEFRQALRTQADIQKDVFTLEGYMNAQLAVYILDQTAPDFSVASINNVIKSLKGVTFKGLPLRFNAKTRELAHLLWIDTGAPEWLRQSFGEAL